MALIYYRLYQHGNGKHNPCSLSARDFRCNNHEQEFNPQRDVLNVIKAMYELPDWNGYVTAAAKRGTLGSFDRRGISKKAEVEDDKMCSSMWMYTSFRRQEYKER